MSVLSFPPASGRLGFILAALALCLLWLVWMQGLMVTPVWDETNFLTNLRGLGSWGELVRAAWIELPIVRPIPLTVYGSLLRWFPEIEGWALLRGLNQLVLLGAFGLLLGYVRRMRGEAPSRDLLFLALFLFSAGAVLTGSWFAQMFDAWALLLLAAGLWLLSRHAPWAAAVAFALGFLCKEVAALIFPFLLFLYLFRIHPRRELLRAGGLAAAAFLVYLLVRSSRMPLGSAEDIHRFEWQILPQQLLAFADLLPFQIHQVPSLLGVAILVAVLVAARRLAAVVGALILMAACGVIYLGMLHQGPVGLINAVSVFQPRLFLVPSVLLALVLMLTARMAWLPLLLLLPATLFGAWQQHERYQEFQAVYAEMLDRSRELGRPLRVWIPAGGGIQANRWRDADGAEYATDDFPDPDLRLEAKSGRLLPP